jgi:hypothetical protein
MSEDFRLTSETIIAAEYEERTNLHHYVVVLRDDQLELIRQIIREELDK